ncbi:hypothetical protein SDC9_107159 [bioreactor metagenome]|uniref:Uncharacterized protein n=1 Tax=bioreactor metagenome TaxID=1076179 RepID=A0A645B5G2_9ZZZZ
MVNNTVCLTNKALKNSWIVVYPIVIIHQSKHNVFPLPYISCGAFRLLFYWRTTDTSIRAFGREQILNGFIQYCFQFGILGVTIEQACRPGCLTPHLTQCELGPSHAKQINESGVREYTLIPIDQGILYVVFQIPM